MQTDLKNLLTDGINLINPLLNNSETLAVLEKLYDEISLFNPVYKLVAADGKDLVVKHILDCLAPYEFIARHIKDSSVIADLGSGSGLPGIALASAFKNRFDLVERMGRRAGFLRSTTALCGLADRVSVVEKDLSEVKTGYDIVTFRAFRQMKDIEADLERITKPGSFVIIYKSSEENIKEDLQFINRKIFSSDIISYQVPFSDFKRSLLILEKN